MNEELKGLDVDIQLAHDRFAPTSKCRRKGAPLSNAVVLDRTAQKARRSLFPTQKAVRGAREKSKQDDKGPSSPSGGGERKRPRPSGG